MAYTEKQQRNGATGDGGERGFGGPSSVPDVGGLQSQAEGAGNSRFDEGRGVFQSPQGSGPSSSSGPENAGRQIGGYSSMFEWDSGLAVDEQPGEA